MDVMEKLVELIGSTRYGNGSFSPKGFIENIATHLIANGVTVQEWDGCKYCEEYEDLPEHFIDGEPVGRVFDTCIQPNKNGLWHLEVPCGVDIGIKFCPMCGRKLPEPPKGE